MSIGHEGGNAKKFEDDLVTLALLSSENPSMSLIELYDANADKFAATVYKDKTIGAIEKLNERFGKSWKTGNNSNFGLDKAPAPVYGVKSAKSDIVLDDKAISVKLDTAFVVASAQNKDEFYGIFDRAIEYFVETTSPSAKTLEDIALLREALIIARDNYVGEVKNRKLPNARKVKIVDKFKDVASLYESLSEYVNTVATADTYGEATKDLKGNILKTIQDILKRNVELKQYIIWEGLTSTLKYNGEFPSAQWVLSPDGIYSIKNPNDPYVVACAKVAKFDIRGLPNGRMRSGSTAFTKYYKKQVEAGNNVDVATLYNEMIQMAFGMKIDISSANLKKLKVAE